MLPEEIDLLRCLFEEDAIDDFITASSVHRVGCYVTELPYMRSDLEVMVEDVQSECPFADGENEGNMKK